VSSQIKTFLRLQQSVLSQYPSLYLKLTGFKFLITFILSISTKSVIFFLYSLLELLELPDAQATPLPKPVLRKKDYQY